MQRIWTPAQPPPDPAEIQVRSPEASIILSVLRRAQRRRPDGRDYYRCLYTKKFGAPPDASVSGNSQSTTDFSQTTVTDTQRSQMSTFNKERCTLRGPLISTEPGWRGTSDSNTNYKNSITNLASQISHQPETPSHFPQSTVTHIDTPMQQNVANVILSSQVTLPSASRHARQSDFSELTNHKVTNTPTVLGPICASTRGNASLYQEDVETDQLQSSQIDLFLSQASTPALGCQMPSPTNLQQDAEEENISDIVGIDLVDTDREGNRKSEECSPPFECSPGHYDNDCKEQSKSLAQSGDADSTATSKHSIESQKTSESLVISSEMKDVKSCIDHKGDKMSQEMKDTTSSTDKQPVQLLLKRDTMSAEPMLEDDGIHTSEQLHSLSLDVKQSEGIKNATVKAPSSFERIEDLSFDIGCFTDSDIMESFPPDMSQVTTDLSSQKTPQSQDKGDISEYLLKEQIQQTSASVAIKEPVIKTNAAEIQTERETTISPCKVNFKVRQPSQAICESGAYENESKCCSEESTQHCSDGRSHAQASGSAIRSKLLLSTSSPASVTTNGANISDASGLNASFSTLPTVYGKRQSTIKEKVTPKSVSPFQTPEHHIQHSKDTPSKEAHTEMLPMQDKRATPGSAIQAKLQLWTKANRSDATPHTRRTSKPGSSSDEPPAKKCLYSLPQANKRTFMAPFKGEGKQTNQGEPKKVKALEVKEIKCTIRDASTMSQNERQQAVTDMLGVGQVSMALVYGDGTSQLREPTTKGIPKDSDNKAVGIAVAFPRPSSGAVQACSGQAKRIRQLQFILFPLNLEEKDYAAYCRETLTQLMASKAIRVCLDAQELILTMISHFSLDLAAVYNWSMVDPKVAGWLLNPDHPPNTFTEVVKMLCKKKSQECDHDADANTLLCQDLSQLLDVMELLRRRLMDCDLLDLYLDVEMKLTPILASRLKPFIITVTVVLCKKLTIPLVFEETPIEHPNEVPLCLVLTNLNTDLELGSNTILGVY
ncbi:serine-rich adhesin for platelets-like [Branchiostoma lanceolatum]|uniref:serine-rich adhesin for platelets-like n=1 Tax=Branchiostoma lanceolatum TaxID=7740 RepID=UPI003452DBB9